jgi:transposase-like protein
MMRASHRNASSVVAVVAPDLLPPPAVVFERHGRPEVMEHRHQLQVARSASDQRSFKAVKAVHRKGKSFTIIARETGLNWRTVAKWAGLDVAPKRRTMAAKTTTPETFRAHLARRWSEGCTMGSMLLAEIKLLGYTGSFTHLQRLLCKWRQAHFAAMAGAPAQQAAIALKNRLPPEVAPIAAAALRIKPRGLLTEPQAAAVDALKMRSPDFAKMRQLAMRFRGILRAGQDDRLDAWLHDALESKVHRMRRFAITLQQDIVAVRNAINEPWSNGQTEGQINRLKTLKRAMYGRAGVELPRARLLPLPPECANAN